MDAQDEFAVEDLFQQVATDGGPIDISFTAVGPLASQYGNRTNAVELSVDDFMVPLTGVVGANFIIARAAARRMVQQRSGTILLFDRQSGAGPRARCHRHWHGLRRSEVADGEFGGQLGPVGVRVLYLRMTVNVDGRTIQDTLDIHARQMNVTKDQMISTMAGLNLLKAPASTADTAKAAAFLVSERARMMTGTVVSITKMLAFQQSGFLGIPVSFPCT